MFCTGKEAQMKGLVVEYVFGQLEAIISYPDTEVIGTPT